MANYVLSNNTTISFPEIKVLKDYNDSSFEEIKAIVSNYKSPIGFGKDYPELMKIIFNNKWFNDLFPNYTKIEDIIKLTIETKTRDNCMSNLKSYYRLLKILGDEIMDIIFGEAHTHQYYNIHSDYIMHKIRSKYSNKAELYVNNRSLYKRLVKEDLLYVYYPNDKHNVEYWDELTCLEESKLFYRVEDFYRCSPDAYDAAQFNGWINTYFWLRDYNKCPNFYWTKERIVRLIDKKEFKTREEFKESNAGAFHAAKRNGWLDELIPKFIMQKKWDEDACYELALTCHNISEMAEKSSKAAKYARENGWIEQYTWFENYIENLKDFRYCIYVYTDGIAAYIGLTRDYRIKERHREHNNKKNGKYDALKTYFNNKGEELPKPIILINDLTPELAQYYENFYKEKYESDGYLILNKVATGSLGGGYFRHTKEECENVAKKYEQQIDARK